MKTRHSKIFSIFFTFLLVLTSVLPVFADVPLHDTRTSIKVGYTDYAFFIEVDENGNLSGYGVDYLADICSHTGWNIEYVYAPFDEQLQMLERGEIDIVPMVQRSPELDKIFNYTSQPLGLAQCMLLTLAENKDSFGNSILDADGKTIGVRKNTPNIRLLETYAEHRNFTYNLVEYDTQVDLERALFKREIDIMACEQIIDTQHLHLLDYIGSYPHFLVTNKNDLELIDALNYVISEINSYDPTYTSKLYTKYYRHGMLNEKPYFTREEAEFINSCDTITFGLIADSKPAAYYNESGELTGIVFDILEKISSLSGLEFEYVFMPQGIRPIDYITEHPDVLAAGILTNNQAFKQAGMLVTDPYYTTWTSVVVRTERARTINLSSGFYTVAIPASFNAGHLFLEANYPNLELALCDGADDGLQAVASGKADFFVYEYNNVLPRLGNPRFADLSIIENHLMPNDIGTAAVSTPQNEMLVQIINKCTDSISDETIARIENEHLRLNVYTYSSKDVFYRYSTPIIIVSAIVIAAFIGLLMVMFFRQRKYARETTHRAEHDLMTNLYNRAAIKAKAETYLQTHEGVSCALLMIDLDGLKGINDNLGHAAGDEAIIAMADVLKSQFRETDLIGRIGGDEYAVFLTNIDSKEVLTPILERLLSAIQNTYIQNGTVSIGGSIGATIAEATKDGLKTFYNNADEALYYIKANGKNAFAYYDEIPAPEA